MACRLLVAQVKQQSGFHHSPLSEEQRVAIAAPDRFLQSFHKLLNHAVTTDILLGAIPERRLKQAPIYVICFLFFFILFYSFCSVIVCKPEMRE